MFSRYSRNKGFKSIKYRKKRGYFPHVKYKEILYSDVNNL